VKSVVIALNAVAVGGMETMAVDLAAELSRRGVLVSAVVPRTPQFDVLEDRFAAVNARVERLDLDHAPSRLHQLRDVLHFVRLLWQAKADVVHLHTGGAAGGLAVALATRGGRPRAGLVLTEHDIPDDPPPHTHVRNRAFLDRLVHVLVAVSRRNAFHRDRILPARCRNFAVVLNGVPLPTSGTEDRGTRDSLRHAYDLRENDVVIGSLVRLAPTKGIDTLLRAFQGIASVREGVRLVIVGDGPLRSTLEDLAKDLAIDDRVTFAGFHKDPLPHLSLMDIFVLPVPSGSMSIALLEAMARGCAPVITFGGPEEAVIDGQTGWTAPPSDPPGLGEVLIRLVDNPEERQRLGTQAAAHVASHFSVDRVTTDYLELYRLAVNRRTRIPFRLAASSPPTRYPGTT